MNMNTKNVHFGYVPKSSSKKIIKIQYHENEWGAIKDRQRRISNQVDCEQIPFKFDCDSGRWQINLNLQAFQIPPTRTSACGCFFR